MMVTIGGYLMLPKHVNLRAIYRSTIHQDIFRAYQPFSRQAYRHAAA